MQVVLLIYLCIVMLYVPTCCISNESYSIDLDDDGFPRHIPEYIIRKDVYTRQRVSSGRLKLISLAEPLSVLQLRRALQCIPKRRYIKNERGLYEMMSLITQSQQVVERVCAWLEPFHHPEIECDSRTDERIAIPWTQCQLLADEYKRGKYSSDLRDKLTSPYQARLVRVFNQSLFLDFPWGVERFPRIRSHENHWKLFLRVLKQLKPDSIGDSVFIIGEEFPMTLSTQYIPFPIFSNCASIDNHDLSLPWKKDYEAQLDGKRPAAIVHFRNKLDKAAFFGNPNNPLRMFVFDAASLRPDLIDAGMMMRGGGKLWSWNPLSNEKLPRHASDAERSNQGTLSGDNHSHRANLGMSSNYDDFIVKRIRKYSNKYKYLIVLDGLHATADRLAEFLKQGLFS